MAKLSAAQKHEAMKARVLLVSAKSFLENGYTATTLKSIASGAGINIGSLMNLFGSKEELLAELVAYVLDSQFAAAAKMLSGITEDKILFYAAETTLQLYICESSENIREMYSAAYSMPRTSDIIQHTITGKLEAIFHDHLPDLQTKDFYELEIASGGIMRSFMTRPCDMYFTMERKVRRFLETTFLIYEVPKEKIAQAVEFVKQFDYETIARELIEAMVADLEARITGE